MKIVTQHSLEEMMIEAMREKGWRITEQRKCLAQLFSKKDSYLSPMDVYEAMSKKFTGISYDTIYRNLRQLHDLGVLEQYHFSEGVKFKGCHLTSHHHHAICMSCKKSFPIDFCPIENAPNLPSSFKIVTHNFEIYGQCQDCTSSSES